MKLKRNIFVFIKYISPLVLALQCLIMLVVFFYAGQYLQSPADSPEKSDAIVILGGATGDRLTVGLGLWKTKIAENIMLTGSPDGSSEYYNDWREYILLKHGIPNEHIIKDSSARSSWDEAIIIKSIMARNNWQKVLIISDPPHIRRLSMIYARVFKQSDRQYLLVKTSPQWWQADKWWQNTISGTFVLMEIIKNVYYYLNKY